MGYFTSYSLQASVSLRGGGGGRLAGEPILLTLVKAALLAVLARLAGLTVLLGDTS